MGRRGRAVGALEDLFHLRQDLGELVRLFSTCQREERPGRKAVFTLVVPAGAGAPSSFVMCSLACFGSSAALALPRPLPNRNDMAAFGCGCEVATAPFGLSNCAPDGSRVRAAKMLSSTPWRKGAVAHGAGGVESESGASGFNRERSGGTGEAQWSFLKLRLVGFCEAHHHTGLGRDGSFVMFSGPSMLSRHQPAS